MARRLDPAPDEHDGEDRRPRHRQEVIEGGAQEARRERLPDGVPDLVRDDGRAPGEDAGRHHERRDAGPGRRRRGQRGATHLGSSRAPPAARAHGRAPTQARARSRGDSGSARMAPLLVAPRPPARDRGQARLRRPLGRRALALAPGRPVDDETARDVDR